MNVIHSHEWQCKNTLCYSHIISTLQKDPMLHWNIYTWIPTLPVPYLFILFCPSISIDSDKKVWVYLCVWFLWLLFFLIFQKSCHFRENMYIFFGFYQNWHKFAVALIMGKGGKLPAKNYFSPPMPTPPHPDFFLVSTLVFVFTRKNTQYFADGLLKIFDVRFNISDDVTGLITRQMRKKCEIKECEFGMTVNILYGSPHRPPAPPRLGKKVGENRRENNQINQEKVILSFSQKSAKMQFFTWLKDNCIIIACFYSKIVRTPRILYRKKLSRQKVTKFWRRYQNYAGQIFLPTEVLSRW